ncbi:MAG TPA: helix-turn-helix domain-containing protein [Kofleriaceae bacterium]|nr:helix-turn-helix domain-containing protein [Kofleriaceae bacterium]
MRLLSTRELADAIGVSESSLKRWIDSGKIGASRTEGGHRRVALTEAMRFIRDQRAPIARPELLDLPEISAARARNDSLLAYLLDGDYVAARGFLVGKYLEGARIAELADGPIRDAMHALGELWHHDDHGIFIEHRGTDVCLQAVAQLRALLPAPPAHAPCALGGAPAGDPYLLPSLLASLTALEAGLNAINLGPNTPSEAFAAAVAKQKPKLVWVSISTALTPASKRALGRWLAGLPRTTVCLVGGQQAQTLGALPPHAQRVASMVQIAEVAAQHALA